MYLHLTTTVFKVISWFGHDLTQFFSNYVCNDACYGCFLDGNFFFLLAALEKLIYFSSLISALNYLNFLVEDATRDRYDKGEE